MTPQEQKKYNAELREWFNDYIAEYTPEKKGDKNNPTYDDIVGMAYSAFNPTEWAEEIQSEDDFYGRISYSKEPDEYVDPESLEDCAMNELDEVLIDLGFPFADMKENDNDLYNSMVYDVACQMADRVSYCSGI